MRRIIDICWRLCKQVPLLPITILAAIPLALLGERKPWGEAAWDSWISQVGVDGLSAFNPGVGQWIVIALVAYTIVVTVRGMIDDLRHGHVGVDLLALQSLGTLFVVASLALSKRFLGCMRCRLRARTRRGLFACIGIQNLVVDNRLHFFLRLLEFVERNTQRFCHFGQLVGAKNQEREQQDYE